MDREEEKWYEDAEENTRNLNDPYESQIKSDYYGILILGGIIFFIMILVAIYNLLTGVYWNANINGKRKTNTRTKKIL